MSRRLQQQAPLLHVLKTSSPQVRKAILRKSNKELLYSICECCQNIVDGNYPISRKHKEKLAKHKHVIRQLAGRGLSIKKKRDLVIQKGGFLPILLSAVAPLVVEGISAAIKALNR